MRELYRADLERLGRDLTEIARLVHRAMMDAQAALEAADVHGAERVISEDARIDQLQESLDEQAVRILALQAPVFGLHGRSRSRRRATSSSSGCCPPGRSARTNSPAGSRRRSRV